MFARRTTTVEFNSGSMDSILTNIETDKQLPMSASHRQWSDSLRAVLLPRIIKRYRDNRDGQEQIWDESEVNTLDRSLPLAFVFCDMNSLEVQ